MAMHKSRTVDLNKLIIPAIAAAREAGRAILGVYSSDFAVERKADGSPLTLADKRSHDIIVKRLAAIPDADIPVLSEEGEDIPYEARKPWEYFWLIDPLDGTREFIKRNGEFTVNIALIREHRPVLGVIYAPAVETLYFAHEGAGAYKETPGLKNRLPLPKTRDRFTIVGSRSHAANELTAFVGEMKKKYNEVDFIAVGSSLKFCIVAEGRADVYPRFGPTMEWDTAAGQAIAEEAGSIVTAAETGELLVYNKPSLLNPWFSVASAGRSPESGF
jgi:3'(2'), 5'-bisphosphate nucleotidase